MKVNGVPSLRSALAAAAAAGLTVRYVHGTGETLVYRPGERALRVNVRRKDAPARLLTMLRRTA